MKLYAAPLQGYTEAIWRNLHEEMFGGIEEYYTPFIRLEKGQIRNKDIREIKRENNTISHLIPQVIAQTPEELDVLLSAIEEYGYTDIDLNLGCPFPPIAQKHRGAGLLPFPKEVEKLLSELNHYSHLRFSLKMRLGMNDASEWLQLMDSINKAPLRHVTLHPRIGKQQYSGEIDKEACHAFVQCCQHPVIYNGDVQSLSDMERIEKEMPRLSGIMIGRGLLAHPFLSAEYREGRGWTESEAKESIRLFHRRLYQQMCEWLTGGDAQILSKIKPYWEYLFPEMDKKSKKAIHKASTLDRYLVAVEEGLR